MQYDGSDVNFTIYDERDDIISPLGNPRTETFNIPFLDKGVLVHVTEPE
jgi:hypothetical protein